MTPELGAGLHLRVAVNTLEDGLQVEAIASTKGVVAGRVSGAAGADLTLPLAHPKLWSPDSPFLYDLEVILKKDGKEVDKVTSYFGMRNVTLGRDSQGTARILVNGEALFEIGTIGIRASGRTEFIPRRRMTRCALTLGFSRRRDSI